MIKLTRLNGRTLYLNAELVRFVEPTPDTVISLTDGDRIVVRESPEEVVEAIIDYQRKVRVRTLTGSGSACVEPQSPPADGSRV